MLGGTIRWVGDVRRYCEVGGACQVYEVDMSTVCTMYYRRWVWEVR